MSQQYWLNTMILKWEKFAETGQSLKQRTVTEEKAVYELRHSEAKSFNRLGLGMFLKVKLCQTLILKVNKKRHHCISVQNNITSLGNR